jgi:hypothetical protein
MGSPNPATSANLPRRFDGERAARAALALGLLALLSPLLFLSSHEIALADDAYYYLLPAANFWSLGYFSFDGLTGTNGFHPLWMALVTACALPLHLAGALEGLPRVVLWLSVALTIWGGLVWYGVLRRGGVPRVLAALIVVVTIIACQDLLLSGLESVAVFWSLALLAGYLIARIAEGAPLQPGRLALYSLLALFSRLDCGLFLLLFYVLLLPFAGLRPVFIAGVLLTLLAAPYLLMNVAWHGAATPISGRVKQHWGDRYELETVGRIHGVSLAQMQVGPGKTRLRHITRDYLPRDLAPGLRALSLGRIDLAGNQRVWVPWVLGAALLTAGLRLALALRPRPPLAARFLAGLAVVLLAFYVVSTLYYALAYDRVWPWYGAVGVMVMAAGLTWLAGGVLAFPRGALAQSAVLAVLLVFWTTENFRDLQKAGHTNPQSLRAVYLDMADWLAHHTPKDAVAAGWAVGEIGWHAQRPVINLEGLASNESLLEANKATDLFPFLALHDVRYLCNFWRPSLAPRPEELLGPQASIGAWKRDPVRYFWTLRLRPMMDCPEAFSVLHRNDAGDAQETSGYVIGVDQETLARFLEARAAWRARLAATATVVPAEDLASIRGGKVEANIGRTEGYFVRGAELVYALENLAVGEYEVYGRICNLSAKEGSVDLSHGTGKQTAPITDDPQWKHVRLGSIGTPDGAAEAELHIAGMSGGVYLDQLYLVAPEKRADFEAVDADWWTPVP